MDNSNVTIEVTGVTKEFRVYNDKSHTFKDRILFGHRNKYRAHRVLNSISFTVERGQALGLIGHNGCGKSTTLKLLNKILYPDKGTIKMKGRISSLIELGAGFHPDMSGRENIYINASIFGLKRKEIDERLEDIIRFSELEEFIDNPVRTYSSGMYMRLAFAIAINVDADILLVDEILAVGDANFQKKCFTRLERIKHQGATIVIVSHSMDQIKSICNRVLWLENGEIREDGDPRIVCQDYLLSMEEKALKRRIHELEDSGEQKEEPVLQYPPVKVCAQCSEHGGREGNMRVRFAQASLIDTDGNVKRDFRIGETLILKGKLECTEKLRPYNLIIKIFNRFGGHCTTIETKWDEIDFRKYGEVIPYRLCMQHMNLVPGEYFLECAIRDSNGELADNLTHFIDFGIGPKYNNERDNLGTVNVDYDWHFDETVS